MADNLASLKIEINSSGVKKATDELNNLSNQSTKTEKSVGTLSETFNSMKTTAVAVGLAGISYEVSKLAKEGIKLNSQFEQMKLGIASLIAVNSANISSTGKSITAIEKFTMAQNQAREAVELLKKANLQTPATLMQITEGYQAALGPALRLGLSVKETVNYVKLMTMAAAAMGAPMNQIAQESRALLSGEIDMNAQVARNLQITNEQVKMHTKQGDLYAWLTTKLQDFSAAGDEMSKSWEGVTSNLEESWQTLEMALTKDIFESFKVGILDVNKYLSNTKEVMSDIHTITDYAKAIAEITIALGAVKVTMIGLSSAQKIYNGYLLATTIQTTAYSLATNTTTTSLARMTLGQYAATLATRAWTVALNANPLIFAATAIVAGIYAVVKATDAFTDAQDRNKKASADYVKKQDAYFKSYQYTIDELKKPLGELEKQEQGYLNGVKSARESGNKSAEKVFQANVDRIKKEKKVYQDAIDKQNELAEAKFKASKGIPSGELVAKAKEPEVDKTKKGKTDAEKEADRLEKERLKALEEEAKEARKLDHDLNQSKLSNIQKIIDANKLKDDLELQSLQDLADRQAQSALSFYDMVTSETQKINDANLALFESNQGLWSDEQMQTFYSKWQESIDGVKGGYAEISDMIDNLQLGDDFSQSFNGMSKSIANASKAMKNFSTISDKVAKAKDKINTSKELSDEQKKVKLKELENKEMIAQVDAYGNLAGAASAFFEEGSQGAKTLQAAQAALAVVSAALGVAEQAKLPFPANIAAMATTAATVFSALSSAGIGGGGFISATPPPSATMGTVLGGGDYGQSESINNIVDIMQDIHVSEYAELRDINKAVTSMAQGIEGAVTNLFRSGAFDTSGIGLSSKDSQYNMGGMFNDVSGGAAIGATALGLMFGPIGAYVGGIIGSAIGPLVAEIPVMGGIVGTVGDLIGGIGGTLFGGNTSQKIIGSGLAIQAGTLAQKAGGNVGAGSYADIETHTDGGWFSSSSESVSRQTKALDAATSNSISLIYQSFDDTMMAINKGLGTHLEKTINDYQFQAVSLNLKGLTGDAATKKLNDMFSAQGDRMVTNIFGTLISQYQKLGEGLLESAVRVITEKEVVLQDLASINKRISGDVIGITQSLVNLSGGLSNLQESTASYYENFFTESERLARSQVLISEAFTYMNTVMPKSNEEFRALIEAQDLSTESGRELFTELIGVSGAFYDINDQLQEISNTAKEAFTNTFDNIQNFIDGLRGTSIQNTSASFYKFTSSFNDMISAISSGALDIEEIGNKTIENASNYLNAVTATATSSRDIEFAKAMLINKFSGVLDSKEVTLSNINTTLNNNNAQLVAELQALKFELNSIKNMTIDQTAITQNSLISLRGILSEVSA